MSNKRGDISPDGTLVFWRKSAGVDYWVTPEVFQRKRAQEEARIKRFKERNPDYIPHSHKPEVAKLRRKKYREENREKVRQSFRSWRVKNLGHLKEYANRRYREIPEVRARILTSGSFRRSAMRGKLSGSELNEVRFLYALASSLSCGGIKHVVDHYLPIKPKHGRYCGLTNSNNLRVIPEIQNATKKNKCPIEQQAQNAQIGRIGTQPAQMGGMQTQGMNQ